MHGRSTAVDGRAARGDACAMNNKSHKGQRHKGCGLCDVEKRAGNGSERRPAADRRQIERLRSEMAQALIAPR